MHFGGIRKSWLHGYMDFNKMRSTLQWTWYFNPLKQTLFCSNAHVRPIPWSLNIIIIILMFPFCKVTIYPFFKKSAHQGNVLLNVPQEQIKHHAKFNRFIETILNTNVRRKTCTNEAIFRKEDVHHVILWYLSEACLTIRLNSGVLTCHRFKHKRKLFPVSLRK